MEIKKYGELLIAFLVFIMAFGGYLAIMGSVISGVVYAIYLAGPGGIAFGMALWKGLLLFFAMFFGGIFSILTSTFVVKLFK